MTIHKTRRHIRQAAILAAVSVAAAYATGAMAADPLPKSGTINLRYTWVNPTTSAFGAVARADGGMVEAGGWIAWLMRNDGTEGFGHKMTGKCVGMFGQKGGAYDLVLGDCVYSDSDGDKLYEHFEGLKGTLTGGTGKYDGLSGTADLTDIAVSNESGYNVLSGVKVGTYTLK